jgi:hypothetical protein
VLEPKKDRIRNMDADINLSLQEALANPYSFEEEEDIIIFFNRILLFLVQLFGMSKQEAVRRIDQYYEQMQARQQQLQKDPFWKDYEHDWIEDLGRDEAYLGALRIQHWFIPSPKVDNRAWELSLLRDPSFAIKSEQAFASQKQLMKEMSIHFGHNSNDEF